VSNRFILLIQKPHPTHAPATGTVLFGGGHTILSRSICKPQGNSLGMTRETNLIATLFVPTLHIRPQWYTPFWLGVSHIPWTCIIPPIQLAPNDGLCPFPFFFFFLPFPLSPPFFFLFPSYITSSWFVVTTPPLFIVLRARSPCGPGIFIAPHVKTPRHAVFSPFEASAGTATGPRFYRSLLLLTCSFTRF